jgi:hypothetical protein
MRFESLYSRRVVFQNHGDDYTATYGDYTATFADYTLSRSIGYSLFCRNSKTMHMLSLQETKHKYSFMI